MVRIGHAGLARGLVFAGLLATTAASAQAPAAAPPLSPELQLGLRCAALFSIIAGEQARQAPGAADWPPLAERGREFFVRVAAQAMDAGKLDRAGITALIRAEAVSLEDRAAAERNPATSAAAIKVPCLTMLEAVVPAGR
jgi:hypothetical protein